MARAALFGSRVAARRSGAAEWLAVTTTAEPGRGLADGAAVVAARPGAVGPAGGDGGAGDAPAAGVGQAGAGWRCVGGGGSRCGGRTGCMCG